MLPGFFGVRVLFSIANQGFIELRPVMRLFTLYVLLLVPLVWGLFTSRGRLFLWLATVCDHANFVFYCGVLSLSAGGYFLTLINWYLTLVCIFTSIGYRLI
jgi:hypothetical protein